MKRFPSRLAIAMLAGFLALPAAAADSIAKVNGVAIPAERAEAMLAEQRAQGAPDNEQLKDAVREELITAVRRVRRSPAMPMSTT